MTLSSIRAAAKTQRAEDWFWRVVLFGVVCDFLYLGWLAARLVRENKDASITKSSELGTSSAGAVWDAKEGT